MRRVIFVKFAVDFAMTVLLFTAMAYPITDNTVHELVGMSIFALFIAHNILNKRWYAKLLKGRYDVPRVLRTAVNLLLVMLMLAALVSAIFISQTVFRFITVEGSLFMRQIHVASAYWGFILMSIHLGMHWGIVTGAFRKMIGITGKSLFRSAAVRAVTASIILYGAYFSFERKIVSKLILQESFDFWDKDKSAVLFFIGYLSVMGMYISITYSALKLIQKMKMPQTQRK